MEPEQLAPYGYEVPDAVTKVRDKLALDTNITTAVNHIKMMDYRKVSGVTTTWMFVTASGHAPVRAAA
eukprot:5184227-Amphidinium_carterae.1